MSRKVAMWTGLGCLATMVFVGYGNVVSGRVWKPLSPSPPSLEYIFTYGISNDWHSVSSDENKLNSLRLPYLAGK